MWCRKCGKLIPDDSLFCQYCGSEVFLGNDNTVKEASESPEGEPFMKEENTSPAIDEKTNTGLEERTISTMEEKIEISPEAETNDSGNMNIPNEMKAPNTVSIEEQPKKKKHIFIKILGILVALIAIAIGVIYISAKNAANAYETGVELYQSRKYADALACFYKASVPSYSSKDSQSSYPKVLLYQTLCEGHIEGYLTKQQVSFLVNYLDFADIPTLLLQNLDTAGYYLSGKWESKGPSLSDEDFYLVFSEDHSSYNIEYNFPLPDEEQIYESFDLADGSIVLFDSDGKSHRLFSIKVLTANTISVTCFTNHETVVLYRQGKFQMYTE